MRRTRGHWISILFVLGLVAAAAVGFATGTRPALGLDLEGGVSVTLTAPAGTPADVMSRAADNIRERVDALGVAEPQIFVTGPNVEVQLPGLARGTIEQRRETKWCLVGEDRADHGCLDTETDANAALEAVEVSVEEQFCLVDGTGGDLSCYASKDQADAALSVLAVGKQEGEFCLLGPTGQSLGCHPTKDEATSAKDAVTVASSVTRACLVGQTGLGCFQTERDAAAALEAIRVQRVDVRFCVVSSSDVELGCYLTRAQAEARQQETGQERLLELIGTTARLEFREVRRVIFQGDPAFEATPVDCPEGGSQEGCSFEDLAERDVVFLNENGTEKYLLGPVEMAGDGIDRATATYQTPGQNDPIGGWVVAFRLTGEGSDAFAEVTKRLAPAIEGQQGGQLAIVLDREVISAPAVTQPGGITGGSGEITGSFSEREARDLATVLNAGALPVELTKQEVVTVSPTLGEESLRQGLVAGLVGLGALCLYLAYYYRLLGVVTWFGMSIWSVLALGVVSLLGRTAGYSLTLAGVAGLIVSLGITADSYIVFYERLKDEVRKGKTPRSAVAPAFARAWHTILAADLVTILAAVVLYVLAVGSVRGFALTLGVATGLDMFVVYLFKRPTVFLIARSERLTNLRGFGLSSGVAARAAIAGPISGEAS